MALYHVFIYNNYLYWKNIVITKKGNNKKWALIFYRDILKLKKNFFIFIII